jgi:putative ABC transport system permease protein
MYLALKEMQRAKVRFGLLIAAIGLLVFLILFQQSLQNGLLTSFVGGIRNQSAPILVYGVDGQRVIQGSVIRPDLEQLVREAEQVSEVGRIGQGTFTARGTAGTADVSLIGYEIEGLGSVSEILDGRMPIAPGEGVISDADISSGFSIGTTVTLLPSGNQILIVGSARDVQLNAGPTLFVDYATYIEAVVATNPDADTPLPNVLAVRPAPGMSAAEAASAINTLSGDLDALTRSAAADLTPGVAEVRQSFQIIFGLYAIVVPCVTGLFFLIVTFQKARVLTLLRALGATPRRLVGSLLTQATLIIAAGYLLGIALYAPISQQQLGGIVLRFETRAVIGWALALMVLGLGSALAAARRVLAIDPADATSSGAGL